MTHKHSEDSEELHVLASLERLVVQMALAVTSLPKTLLTCLLMPRRLTVHLNLPDDARSRPVVVDGVLAPGLYSLILMVASAFIMGPILRKAGVTEESDGSVFGPSEVNAISEAVASGEGLAVFAALMPIYLFVVVVGYMTGPLKWITGVWWNARARFGAAAYLLSSLIFVAICLLAILYRLSDGKDPNNIITLAINYGFLVFLVCGYTGIMRGPLPHPPVRWWKAVLGGVGSVFFAFIAIMLISGIYSLLGG